MIGAISQIWTRWQESRSGNPTPERKASGRKKERSKDTVKSPRPEIAPKDEKETKAVHLDVHA